MKTVALIPIKLGSKRVPGKNIKPFFDGTPLMHFIQKACLWAKNIDEVYIYCSDDAVQEYILPGVKYLKRPEYLDGDNINANDFIREFMKTVDADIYVNAHTTSPFAKVSTIEECVDKVASGEYDSAFCAEALRTFMWENGKPINFDPDHFPRTQDLLNRPDVPEDTMIIRQLENMNAAVGIDVEVLKDISAIMRMLEEANLHHRKYDNNYKGVADFIVDFPNV